MGEVISAFSNATVVAQIIIVILIFVIVGFLWKYFPMAVEAVKVKFKSKPPGASGDASATVIINSDSNPGISSVDGDLSSVLISIGAITINLEDIKAKIDAIDKKSDASIEEHKKIIDIVKKVGVATGTIYTELQNIMSTITTKTEEDMDKFFNSFKEED